MALKKKFYRSHHQHITSRHYWKSLSIGLMLLCIALIGNFFAGEYATHSMSNPVTDIILSNTRAYDVDGIFTYGALLFIIYITFLCFWHPGKAPFMVKSISLFVFIRSISISLTHIGPFPTHTIVSLSDFLQNFIFTGDLFFSGHTGLPFLVALIFWKHTSIRIFCILISIIFGTIVLLGHLHYSIDVFSAFFITYSVYKISEFFFTKDYIIAQNSQ